MTNNGLWAPFNFLVGTWEGIGEGEPGVGQYKRTYEFILNGKFLHVRNRSAYPPSDKYPQGEIHEDWGFINWANNRGTFLFRQFHIEGFVNQYVLDHVSNDGSQFVFMSESIDNIQPGWRARESYQVLSVNEFIELFELAAPGKEFMVYTRCRLKRVSL